MVTKSYTFLNCNIAYMLPTLQTLLQPYHNNSSGLSNRACFEDTQERSLFVWISQKRGVRRCLGQLGGSFIVCVCTCYLEITEYLGKAANNKSK